MRTFSIFAASASLLLSQVQARIGGISVPSIIKAGDTFNLIIEGTDYIQSVTDVSLAVGYFPGAAPLGDGLGSFITAFDLGQFRKSRQRPQALQSSKFTDKKSPHSYRFKLRW